MSKIKQTAGRDALGDFAPEFAHFNDDILFGENWNNQDIDLKTRCIITVVALMSAGITDQSLSYHLANAKKHGVSKKEIAAIITHVPSDASAKEAYQASIIFPIGQDNSAYEKYFVGQSYLAPISNGAFPIFNVTFEPGCRNHWHSHRATKGGGQVLICVGGQGYYQEWGKDAVKLQPGDTVTIPANTKHWHGASKDSWFSHLAFEIPGENTSTEWNDPVSEEDYLKAQE